MSDNRPLVTALINTYNYGRFLPFAINSVLTQTYPNIEVIVVDDGSTDHTNEVLAHYKDRINTIRTENGGQAHAFNVGIPRAKGQLIMLLDADDVWLPTKVERMVELASKRPTAGMIYHRFQNIDTNGKIVSSAQPLTLADGDYRESYKRSGGSWWSPITSVLAFRPQYVRKALPIPTYPHREGADTVLTDYCITTCEVASHPDVLTLRRLHGSNLYAAGRDGYSYRSREIREADIRRVEWRMSSLRRIAWRNGQNFEVNVDRNEWRVFNLYWLGRTSSWKALWVCMTCPEHSMKDRWQRFVWARENRRLYNQNESN